MPRVFLEGLTQSAAETALAELWLQLERHASGCPDLRVEFDKCDLISLIVAMEVSPESSRALRAWTGAIRREIGAAQNFDPPYEPLPRQLHRMRWLSRTTAARISASIRPVRATARLH